MLNRLKETFKFLAKEFVYLFSLILIIFGPIEILLNYFELNYVDPNSLEKFLKFGRLIYFLFSPIVIIATINLLEDYRNDKKELFIKYLKLGFKKWGTVLKVRAYASFKISFGFLLLIIPGIIYLIRFLFIDYVVVLEVNEVRESTYRSNEISKNRKWIALLNFLVISLIFSFIVYTGALIYYSYLSEENLLYRTIFDLFIDFNLNLFTIYLFFLYCSFTGKHVQKHSYYETEYLDYNNIEKTG
jgi:hypothetical protein